MSFCIMVDQETGRSRPEIVCDNCHQVIEDIKMANLMWQRDVEPQSILGIFVAHKKGPGKRSCTDELEMKDSRGDQTKSLPWMSLSDYISWLLWNKDFGEKTMSKEDDLRATDKIVLDVRRPVV